MSLPALHVEHLGARPAPRTVVLSHGMAEDSTTWAGVAAALAPRTHFVLWDLPGHGRSAPLDNPADYDAHRSYASLVQVVEQHGRDRADAAGAGAPVVLGGHSLGGYISCRYAIEHPEAVAGLILVATGPGFRDEGARARWNDDVRATAERTGRPAALLGLHDDAFVIENLASIRCPVLLLVGSRDKAFLGATDYFERKLATVERHTIEGAGHGVVRSHTAEVIERVAPFLARVGAAVT